MTPYPHSSSPATTRQSGVPRRMAGPHPVSTPGCPSMFVNLSKDFAGRAAKNRSALSFPARSTIAMACTPTDCQPCIVTELHK